MVIGGGVAGTNAASVAIGMGASVTMIDKSTARLKELDALFSGRAKLYDDPAQIEKLLPDMDVVIGAVLVPGMSAPKLVTKPMLKNMKAGAVMVDIAIDQGGCFETSHATTHADPVYTVDGVVHYCVANMPGAVPRTSAMALNHAILPYALKLADMGWEKALASDSSFAAGLNICHGKIIHKGVAESLGFSYVSAAE
jgi:alanine dehydrogenase